MPSDLTTKDILDRLDAIETRQSAERASARVENRWLNIAMLLVIAALAGIQISGFGISAKPSATATVSVGSQPEAAPVVPVMPDQPPADPAGNTPIRRATRRPTRNRSQTPPSGTEVSRTAGDIIREKSMSEAQLKAQEAHKALLAKITKSPLASKKLWVTVLGIASIVVPAVATGGVSLPVVLGVVPAVVAYVLGQAYVDAATAKALSDVAAASIAAAEKR
jgi:hypothetical protein